MSISTHIAESSGTTPLFFFNSASVSNNACQVFPRTHTMVKFCAKYVFNNLCAAKVHFFDICKKNRPERQFFYLVSVLKLLLYYGQSLLCLSAWYSVEVPPLRRLHFPSRVGHYLSQQQTVLQFTIGNLTCFI